MFLSVSARAGRSPPIAHRASLLHRWPNFVDQVSCKILQRNYADV